VPRSNLSKLDTKKITEFRPAETTKKLEESNPQTVQTEHKQPAKSNSVEISSQPNKTPISHQSTGELSADQFDISTISEAAIKK
jgi:hypothetical protein